jgi:phage terminase small subunit
MGERGNSQGPRSNIRASIGEALALSPKERHFASLLAEGKSPKEAYVLSGYNGDKNATRVAQRPAIQAYARKLYQKNERATDMSRKRVMDGFLEAIEQAKLMSEPMTQVAGWREIAKMCGYYAPEVKRIDINVTSQRVMSQLETLSDADLLELIEKDAETIEGEARELLTISADSAEVVGGEREAASGISQSDTGPEEPDPVREADVPEVSVRVGPRGYCPPSGAFLRRCSSREKSAPDAADATPAREE